MQWAQKQKGFTIVELLIVIVVIAILAAISIVVYNGISQRAKASAVQQALSDARSKLAVYTVDNADGYPTDIGVLNLPSSGGITYQYSLAGGSPPTGYCMTVATGGVAYYTGKNFSYTGASNGTINQDSAAEGACPGHDGAGGAAVVNAAKNPSIEADTSALGQPNGSTIARSNVRAQQGAYSVLVTMPQNAQGGVVGASIFQETSLLTLKPNTTYVVSAYVYVPSATVDIRLAVQGTARASVENTSSSYTSVKNSWVRIHNTFSTNEEGSIILYLLNRVPTPTAGTQFWADGIMITEGSGLSGYADGNSPGWVWDGAVNRSSSRGPAL